MEKRFIYFLFLLIIVYGCARIGTPTGGPKDETPPKITSASPPSEQVNFNANKIRINFDEYIKFKDLNKHLIISPPMKTQPEITPLGFASKYIEIKLKDTLKDNTTYTFNFGNAIVDNSEGNIYQQFKYLFSTGDYIDSLKLTGTFKDAYYPKTNYNASIQLYAIDENYNDSIIYKKKPDYITNSLDSLNFELTNLKAGKYAVIALKDKSGNMTYNPKEDEIGFLDNYIDLPNDSIVNILITKEKKPFSIKKPVELNKNHIVLGYEGDWDAEIVSLTDLKGNIISFQKSKELTKDTINIWYENVEDDTLRVKIKEKNLTDDFIVKLHSKKRDTLLINEHFDQILGFRDTISFSTNIPINKLDINKIQLTTNDSLPVVFEPYVNDEKTKFQILFDKKPSTQYQLKILPNAISDIFGNTHDSLVYKFSTKKIEDYGELKIKLKTDLTQNFIVELLNDKLAVIQKDIIQNSTELVYKNLTPGKYTIRIVYDDNKNNRWDTSNYLEKKQPEKIIYIPKMLDIRANWSINEEFTIN